MKPIYWVLIIVAAIVLIYGYNQGWFTPKKSTVTSTPQTIASRISALTGGDSQKQKKCCTYSVNINGQWHSVTVSCKGQGCCEGLAGACGLLTSGSRYSMGYIDNLKVRYPNIQIDIV